jgi:hypothetical protein
MTPVLIACAIPLRTSPAALAVTDWTACATAQAGSVKVLHGMRVHPSPGKVV